MKNNNENLENGSANYELKSDAVEQLVNAQKGQTQEYTQEELEKYRSKSKFKIPEPVKILFIKAWFAGAVCFFFLWGLGTYVAGLLDMLFILGVVLGVVTDLLVNNVIRFIGKYPGGNDEWLFFSKKGTASFFLNIVYSFLIIYCVYTLYNVINIAIISITGISDTVPLGVEPILFGIFCMAFDMLFIGMKRLVMRIIDDAKASAGSNGQNPDESST